MSESPQTVFLSYAREDSEIANKLYLDLTNAGVNVWFDEKDILPGQKWELEITQAIMNSVCFLALISTHSTSKRGYVQKELKTALEVLDEYPPSEIFIIPIRLNDCTPAHERLKEYQWVDIFPSYEKGLTQILKALSHKEIIKRKPSFAEIDDQASLSRKDNKYETPKQKPNNLDDLLMQHGYKVIGEFKRQEFSRTIDEFAKLISNKQLVSYFDAESGGFKRDLFEHEKGSLAIRTNQLDFDKLNSYTPNEAFLSILNSLPEGFRFLKHGRFTPTEFKDNKCFKQVIRLIAGNWW